MSLTLHGYTYSVYTRMVRFALAEIGTNYSFVDVNPFDAEMDLTYLDLHPFRRVPVLVDGSFAVYETSAITGYIDDRFAEVSLQPKNPQAKARQAQVMSIVDCYAYWPMVRQVFSNRVFAPRIGGQADEQQINEGLLESKRVLVALENLVGDSGILTGKDVTLADIHLAPTIAYFTAAPEGESMLSEFSALTEWWASVSSLDTFASTDPGLPEYGS